MRSIRNAPKHAIKLSLSSKLLNMVRDTGLNTGLNISQTIDTRLTEEGLLPHCARWQQDNAEAIAHCNAQIQREGLFSDRYRMSMRSVETHTCAA